jgi:hypothetical protein
MPIRPCRPVVPKVACTAPWGVVGLPIVALRGKGAVEGAGGVPLRERCSVIYI